MKLLHGVTVAMITPFDEKGKVKENVLEELTNFLIEKGVDCLYPCGTTGEMFRLSLEERKLIGEVIVNTTQKRVPVHLHVGCMRYKDTLELAEHAYEIGADGIGVVTPAYFTANDRELENYYVSIAERLPQDFPIYLYNIPQLAGNDLTPAVVENILAQTDNIVGIKYSEADLLRTNEYLQFEKNDFHVLHGTDNLFLGLLALGCEGTVSGISGIFPEPYVAIYEAFKDGDREKARKMQSLANKFNKLLRSGSNMAFFKEALKFRGIDAGYMRRPQLELTKDQKEDLYENLDTLTKELSF